MTDKPRLEKKWALAFAWVCNCESADVQKAYDGVSEISVFRKFRVSVEVLEEWDNKPLEDFINAKPWGRYLIFTNNGQVFAFTTRKIRADGITIEGDTIFTVGKCVQR